MKNIVVKEAIYTPKPEEIEIEKVETLDEHKVEQTNEFKINVNINDEFLNEEMSKMKLTINKDDFKSLFGPKSKPKKGDALSIEGIQKKFKVKKAKKYSAKRKGKGYKLTLKSE